MEIKYLEKNYNESLINTILLLYTNAPLRRKLAIKEKSRN